MIFVKIILLSLEEDWTIMNQSNKNKYFDVVLSFQGALSGLRQFLTSEIL